MLRLVFFAALATAAPAPRVTRYARPYTNGWAESPRPVAESESVRFTIALREQNTARLRSIALEVSTPSSPRYGSFLGQGELDALTAPKAADVDAVREWLDSEGVTYVFRTPSRVEVSSSVATASRLLQTRFHRAANGEGQSLVRAGDYSLPAPVHRATAAVFGLHGLPLPPASPLVFAASGPVKYAKVTPEVLASTYKIQGVKPSGSNQNRQAVAEFQGEYMNTTDLATMFRDYVKDYRAGRDDTVSKFVGAPQREGRGVEAGLDIQYIMSPAVGVRTEFWEFPSYDFCSDIAQWAANLSTQSDVPIVHSISYGVQGNLTELHCTDAEVAAIDDNLAKLAAKGIAVMVSSGDSGSCCTAKKCWPSWPASSPWVTAVGATRFVGQEIGAEEMASDQFGSGGGFSFQFDRDDAQWQDSAVSSFLSSADLPPAGSFPPRGRGTPDVAALGEGYQIIVGGKLRIGAGTSASAPAFAAMVSLLNEARISAGKSQLGFLNPFLYANTDAFTDIVKGSGKIDRAGNVKKYGYDCAKGWDPVTGLGTPRFDKLLAAALAA